MNLRVVIKLVFHDKDRFPEVLVVKGLNYIEYVVCWKRKKKSKKMTLGIRGAIGLLLGTFYNFVDLPLRVLSQLESLNLDD